MTSLILLLIVGCAAIAILLACPKGFSRALRYKKGAGWFVSVDRRRIWRPRGPSKTLILYPQGKPQRMSSSTVAMMSMVIALGARGASDDLHSSFKVERSQVPGVQPLHDS
jgi:hypothetical protein